MSVNGQQEKCGRAGEVITLDDTKTRIIAAAIKAVRQYGLEGVRIQNVSELAGISAGAIYRHFDGKDQLLAECFTYVDKQAAEIFERLKFNPLVMLTDPMGAIKSLWLPYFRFWTSHPDETVFYHRFRDSTFFPKYDKNRDVSYFKTFIGMVCIFKKVFPSLDKMNQDLLWLHVLTSTVMYAKYVVEGTLPNNRETEDTVFQLLTTGLSGYLKPDKPKKTRRK
jgi:AcrR family transcriptional regulator